MEQILVFYVKGEITGSLHLSTQYDCIAYTIAEFESRNLDTIITSYQDEYGNLIKV